MRSFFAIVALIGFVGVILFGSFLMIHSGNAKGHVGCLPTLMGTSECKTNISPLEYARVHLGVLMGLTNAIPTFSIMAAFIILIILLYASSIFGFHRLLLIPQERRSYPLKSRRNAVLEKFLEWVALHEKRDPSLAFAAST